MRNFLILLFLFMMGSGSFSQPLTSLLATKDDPLYTTYAAPLSRSNYKIDQGYHFNWTDKEAGIAFTSKDGPEIGIAFSKGSETRLLLKEMFREPVVTLSFSDLISYYYYPFEHLRVEVFFDVYSSQYAISEIKIKNEGEFSKEVDVSPYLCYPSADTINDISRITGKNLYGFPMQKKRDGWMKDHSIPLEEDLSGCFAGNIRFDRVMTFVQTSAGNVKDLPGRIKNQSWQRKKGSKAVKGIIFSRNYRLSPGDLVSFRIISGIEKRSVSQRFDKVSTVFKVDLNSMVRDDEKVYANIPVLAANCSDLNLFYLSCFSLLRQCMMPPEGECKTNYYVFSREPKWGWGYGGQVFHESLAMMAYAYMDPGGAMNSQRVYMSRQRPDGYINYRTGSYLNETIEYNGKSTTSAPLYNYENLEIFKVTKDKKFLWEAYESGKKFYRFYVANRDSNNNGLSEWGGEASLESVRDARVAVWDQVGWPSNFEGPDLNAMLVMEAKSLSEMAKIFGKQKESDEWKFLANVRAEKINRYLWDENTGFYYNVTRDGQKFSFRNSDDLKIKEIIGFLPYWAGITGKGQTEKLLLTLKDSNEFWRPYGVPSLSAREQYYNPIGYWNGPVWVQWNYLIFRGLLDHGDTLGAQELAGKVMDNMIWHLKKDHVFWEFYSPDERQAGWNQTYIWAGIAARFLIDLQTSGKNQ